MNILKPTDPTKWLEIFECCKHMAFEEIIHEIDPIESWFRKKSDVTCDKILGLMNATQNFNWMLVSRNNPTNTKESYAELHLSVGKNHHTYFITLLIDTQALEFIKSKYSLVSAC